MYQDASLITLQWLIWFLLNTKKKTCIHSSLVSAFSWSRSQQIRLLVPGTLGGNTFRIGWQSFAPCTRTYTQSFTPKGNIVWPYQLVCFWEEAGNQRTWRKATCAWDDAHVKHYTGNNRSSGSTQGPWSSEAVVLTRHTIMPLFKKYGGGVHLSIFMQGSQRQSQLTSGEVANLLQDKQPFTLPPMVWTQNLLTLRQQC